MSLEKIQHYIDDPLKAPTASECLSKRFNIIEMSIQKIQQYKKVPPKDLKVYE